MYAKKRGRQYREKKTEKKKQRRKTEKKNKGENQTKNQEQREERLKREGEGEHSPIDACIVTFAFAFDFTR